MLPIAFLPLLLLAACQYASGSQADSVRAAPVEVEDPKLAWVRVLSGPEGGDGGQALAVGSDGAVYVAGDHKGLDTNGDGSVDVPATGINAPFLARFDERGELVWTRSLSGPGYNTGKSVDVSPQGLVFIGGSFRETLSVGSGIRLAGSGAINGYVAAFDTSGSPVWARMITGEGRTGISDLAVDEKGDVVVSGWLEGDVDLDGDGAPDATSEGSSDAFVAAYSAGGEIRWVRTAGGTGADTANGVAAGTDGTVYLAINTRSADLDLDGDGAADVSTRDGGRDIVLAAYDRAGTFLWYRTISGPGLGRASGLARAPTGQLLLAGDLDPGPADFDGDGAPELSPEVHTAFVATYDSEGTLGWVSPLGARAAVDVAAGPGGHAVVAGYFKGAMDGDGDGQPDAEYPDAEASQGFAAVLSPDGTPLHLIPILGPDDDQARAVAYDEETGALYVAGFIRKTADFDGDGTPDATSARLGDLFLARYDITESP